MQLRRRRNSAYVKRRADYDQERERDRLDRETEAKEFAALKELIMAEGKAASADSEARRRHEVSGQADEACTTRQ